MSANARNQPCPCGSGKKYKHCCERLPQRPIPTVDAALDEAIGLHRSGFYGKAAQIYLRILALDPTHADASHLLGLVRHRQGDHETAARLIAQAIAGTPGAAMFHNNLGEVHRATGRHPEAFACYERALQLAPGLAEPLRNIGLTYLDCGRVDDAVAHLEAALRAHPAHAGLHWALGMAQARAGRLAAALRQFETGLEAAPDDEALLCARGIALNRLDRPDDAIGHYRAALARHPASTPLLNNLAQTLRARGRTAEAVTAFEQLLALAPADESVRYQLAALRDETPEHPPEAYVRDLFNEYAEGFEHHLQDKLAYHTPEALADLIARTVPGTRYDTLDLGCGTGLFGAAIRARAARLVGIDLAPRMIAKARQRGIYDALYVDDLIARMGVFAPASFGLVVAADVFIYVGNVAPVFDQARRILAPAGWLAFSIETLEDAEPAPDYRLGRNGRYQHRPGHMLTLGTAHGFKLAADTAIDLRLENGRPVPGRLYLFQRASVSASA